MAKLELTNSDDIKADELLVIIMGIETVLLIVNEKSLNEILNSEWNNLYQMMEKGALRHIRPEKFTNFLDHLILTARQKFLIGWIPSVSEKEQ